MLRRFTAAEQFPTFIKIGRALPKVGKWVGILAMGSLAFVLTILTCVMVLSSVVFTILPYYLKPKVEAEIAAIKARGEPVTPADLAGPKIPDSQNGAVVYERIFREMEKPQVKKDVEVLKRFASDEEREPNPSLWKDARAAVKRTAYLLPMIEEAQSRPKCRFPINWQDGAFAVRLPHLRQLRALSCVLEAQAVLNTKDGNTRRAVRSLTLGFLLSDSLKSEPNLTPQLVRVRQIAVASGGLREAAQYRHVGEVDARRIYETLSGIDLSAGLCTAYQGERAMMIPFFGVLRDRPKATMRQIDKSPAGIGYVESKPRERVNGFWRSYTLADELFYLRTMGQYIACARLPYREIGKKGLNPEPESFPKYSLITVICLPSFGFSLRARDRAEAEVAGSQILLALVAYRDRYRAYPASLAELRAKLGWKLPEDPFNGKDFIYRRSGKGFILYSIGPNLKDDGGIEPSKNDREKGDIVWRMER